MSCKSDLTLDEALADPMIGAALKADGLDPRQFETTLRAAARRIGADRGAALGPTRTGAPPVRLSRTDDPGSAHRFDASGSVSFQVRRCTGAPRRAAVDRCAW